MLLIEYDFKSCIDFNRVQTGKLQNENYLTFWRDFHSVFPY